jgi:hypothetical protein
METNANPTTQNPTDEQVVTDGGLMVLVTDSFGTTSGDDDTGTNDPTDND